MDTSALVAALVADHEHHALARAHLSSDQPIAAIVLAETFAQLRRTFGQSAAAAQTLLGRFDELNTLIEQHNAYLPIERDLPMSPRTGEYVYIHGRTYEQRLLDADWVLARFPA